MRRTVITATLPAAYRCLDPMGGPKWVNELSSESLCALEQAASQHVSGCTPRVRCGQEAMLRRRRPARKCTTRLTGWYSTTCGEMAGPGPAGWCTAAHGFFPALPVRLRRQIAVAGCGLTAPCSTRSRALLGEQPKARA